MLQPFSFILFRAPAQNFNKAYSFLKDASPLFDEGIFLSSVDLYTEWKKIDALDEKQKNKLLTSLYKYWIRSCTRCTPFATFAGCFVADISNDETNLVLNDFDKHKHVSRLDMNFLTRLCETIGSIPAIHQQIKLEANNSLYKLANTYRYADYSIENKTRKYVLTEIEATDYVNEIINAAKNNCSINYCLQILLKQYEVDEEEALLFIDDLIHSHILISSLEPSVTGSDQLKKLIGQLTVLNDADNILQPLKKISGILQQPSKTIQHYQSVYTTIQQLPFKVDEVKNSLQTDLFLSVSKNNLNKELIDEVIKQAADLMLLSKPNNNQHLEDFKRRFLQRYEQTEISLAEAIDADFGIGYANVSEDLTGETPLISDLLISSKQPASVKLNYINKFALKKYAECMHQHKDVIAIQPNELKAFDEEIKDFHFPHSLYLIGSFIKQNHAFDKNNFLFDLSGFGGPSAANLLSRFAHGDDKLNSLIHHVLAEEEKDKEDAVYAEIVHLPEAKIGNILQRPVLRSYEIVYAGKSGANTEHQITVDDLMVSVQNNQIILRSKRLNKQVIPRLSSAHNYAYKSLPVYKFLCDLQTQNTAQPGVWDWGELSDAKFLPRVQYKNIILKKARWKIEEADIKSLPASIKEQGIFCKKLQQQLQLPDQFVIAEGDNELLIDFTKQDGIMLFCDAAKKLQHFIIEEYLLNNNNCIIKDVNDCIYTNEAVIPLQYKSDKKANSLLKTFSDVTIQRKFLPFSEWQYYKLYCGPKSAENILINDVSAFIENGMNNNLFEKFFFIRYKDEFSHLRLRFFNSDKEKQTGLHDAFMKQFGYLIRHNIIHNISIDTYSRELERYTSSCIEDAETIFYNDSIAVLQLLNVIDEHEENGRLYMALKGIDVLLNDFEFDLSQKHIVLKKLQQGFFKEFSGEPVLQKQLNEKYRQHQSKIFSCMAPNSASEIIDAVQHILKERSIKNMVTIKAIKQRLRNNDIAELSKHFIHMFLNRLFISSQRKYELLIYHFLEKYYASQIAILSKK